MRTLTPWLALLLALSTPAFAQSGGAGRSLADKLPLYAKNNCERQRDPAGQLFCGDPELAAAAEKLSGAIQQRLARLPDPLPAIQDNAMWLRQRNLGCGIFGGSDTVTYDEVDTVKACLLKVTLERAAIVSDPDFDCLAASTAAGALICGDPSLAVAETELNAMVRDLIARLNPTEARFAYAEFGRWTRERDRTCNLVGKDNVPLDELASAEPCLQDYLARKTADIVAARGDPKKVFGRQVAAKVPNTDAVDFCVARIHAANSCGNFVRITRVFDMDTEVSAQEALVTAEVEMVVLSPFGVCSSVANTCTGSCWDLRTGSAQATPAAKDRARDSFNVTRRLRIQKAFAFQKAADGWRCKEDALAPVDFGVTAASQ